MVVRASDETQVNEIKSKTKIFSEIPAAWTTLIDLGKIHTYSHLTIYCSLDQNIDLRFGGKNEVTVLAKTARVLDGFRHNGLIEFKMSSVAPIKGALQTYSF